MFPENLVQACFQQVKTVKVPIVADIIPPTAAAVTVNSSLANISTTMAMVTEAMNASNITNVTVAEPEVPMKWVTQYSDGMNVLGTVFMQ